ncbi:MAG TPA: nucleotidyltransferase domain-containing protein [Leptolyngbyaceae cyanobacterium]
MVNPSAQQMQGYIAGARIRQQQQQQALEQQRQSARAVAYEAAQLLKTEFGASRVVLFGSALAGPWHEQSDIDLAVWDLPEKDYLAAVVRLLDLSEFSIDLVNAETASDYLQSAITQGQPL